MNCTLRCLLLRELSANVSVLRWWFEHQTAQLIVNDSLRVELTVAADQRLWQIQLSGLTRLSTFRYQNHIFDQTICVSH